VFEGGELFMILNAFVHSFLILEYFMNS
jgi:hypothetical protein